jgi:hypothetical protein
MRRTDTDSDHDINGRDAEADCYRNADGNGDCHGRHPREFHRTELHVYIQQLCEP